MHGVSDDTLPVEVRCLVAETCDRFRTNWRQSGSDSIERLLDSVASTNRTAVLRALIALDVELRAEHGEHPVPGEYFERFPLEASLISAAFASRISASETIESTLLWSGAEGEASFSLASLPRPPSLPGSTEEMHRDLGSTSPLQLGRYEVLQFLGEGGYGRVYLARDHALGRDVAIKVPKSTALASPARLAALLNEGRSAAALKHPSIVSVFDVGRAEDGSVYVVLEYVKGITLAEMLNRERIKPVSLAACIAEVADAIHHAHRVGVVHRDLKPSNIIIDKHGKPRVTDFGLAVAESVQVGQVGEIAGTPAYMAPEQVRGEAHRLDGRTDIWALGVILYVGLTGRLPFIADTRDALYEEILGRDPQPPRQVHDAVPPELERICLKCLAKGMTDRYKSALELADDLRHWETAVSGVVPSGGRPLLGVVPKGLRSFDFNDAEFFLSLLPGPRDRDGLPESIRSWKSWSESLGVDTASRVGVLHGPSGSGKTSLVKAGLLPRLDPAVRPVYVEATHGETEARVLAALRRHVRELGSVHDLVEAATLLREGVAGADGGKTLIIIDQFEQWLEADVAGPECALVRALRHCDGDRLQALILVRDDFWMGTARFFKWVDVPLIEGRNSATAEPLDPEHARYVLTEFGRACGRVPQHEAPTATTVDFLERATNALVDRNGGIAPVHLNVFFDVVRKRPWTPATLRELGGVEGIGARFIEDALEGRSTSPTHRLHRPAAHAVLRAVLPQSPSQLRGSGRSARELQQDAGYAGRDADFAELMRILDHELRLLTPVETSSVSEDVPTGEPRYQLTHDYLVQPLHLWLTKKQRETRGGRAELRLEEITSEWRQRHESRRLPTLLDWLSIAAFTSRHFWTGDQRQMMRVATRRIAIRSALALLVVLAVGLAVSAIVEQERRNSLLGRIRFAALQDVPHLVAEVDDHWDWLKPELERLRSEGGQSGETGAAIPLILFRQDPSPARGAALHAALANATPDAVSIIGDALSLHESDAGLEKLQAVLLDHSADPSMRLRVACVLARVEPSLVVPDRGLAEALATSLIKEDRRSIPLWLKCLGSAAPLLQAPLLKICSDPTTDQTMLSLAAETLGELLGQQDEAETFAVALVESRPDAAAILRRDLGRFPLSSDGVAVLYQVVDGAEWKGTSQGADTSQRANAAIALAAVGDFEELWSHLGQGADPQLRATLIDRLGTSGLDVRSLIERLKGPGLDPLEAQAVLMAFAETPRNRLTSQEEAELAALAAELYKAHPAAPVHSAAELLLRRLNGYVEAPEDLPSMPRPLADATPHWTTGPNGHEFAVLKAPLAFRMGSPDGEQDRQPSEVLHHRSIPRSLAVATKEVTIAQFKRFRPGYYAGVPDELPFAANVISWYSAAAYCNWLSREAGIPPEEWCYPSDVSSGMALDASALERTGYRLPTEAEWEYFARAGTETSRHFGESDALLPRYGWTWLSSGDETHVVGELLPNQFGLFDTLGNVWEWCHDGPSADSYERPIYPSATREYPASDIVQEETIRDAHSWRIIRGGAYNFTPAGARSAHRDVFRVENAAVNAGIRVVRTLPFDESTPASD